MTVSLPTRRARLRARATMTRRLAVAFAIVTALIVSAAVAPAEAVGPGGTLAVGFKPSDIAITADGTRAYVSNSGDFDTPGGTVTVLNLLTGATVTLITVGTGPQGIAINPAGTKVYVVNRVSGTVSVISTASNTVTKTITVGVGAYDISFSPNGLRAYVSRYSVAGLIDVIDTATETALSPITAAPEWSEGVAVSPDSKTLYVTGSNDNALFLVDLMTNVISPTSYGVGSFPTTLAASPDGHSVYVVNSGVTNSTVSVFNTTSKTVVNSIPVGDYPAGIAVSRDGLLGYVTNDQSDTISVIDLATQTVLTTMGSFGRPFGIDISADGRTVAVTQKNSSTVQVFGLDVDRVSGADRYATAVALTQEYFPTPAAVPYLIVATGDNYPDALAAGPLGATIGGPLLLTATNSLSSAVAAEVARLHPAKILVLGGTGVVSAGVYSQLAGIQSDIDRIQGVDRYETSRHIVEFGFPSADEVWIATGENFPDALSSGAVGAATGYPVVLVRGSASTVDVATLALLTTLGPARIKIAGGIGAVSAGIQSQLASAFPAATVQRFSGANRYDTSLAINSQAYSFADTVLFATGTSFSDALAGAPIAGLSGSPLLVVPTTCVPSATRLEVDRLQTSTVRLLGGTGALNASVFALTKC